MAGLMVVTVRVAHRVPPAIEDGVDLVRLETEIDPIVIATVMLDDPIEEPSAIHGQDHDREHVRHHQQCLGIKRWINVSNPQNESLIVSITSIRYRMIIISFVLASELQGKTEEEIEMLKTMGFATFDSTKVNQSRCFSSNSR